MMTMMSNAKSYDWDSWLVGLLRSFNMGIGGAMTGILGPMVTDYQHFNLGPTGYKATLISMGIGFLVGGIFQLGLFLQTHGAPDRLQTSLATAAAASTKASEAIATAQTQVPPAPKG
jgi:hypothetical protein